MTLAVLITAPSVLHVPAIAWLLVLVAGVSGLLTWVASARAKRFALALAVVNVAAGWFVIQAAGIQCPPEGWGILCWFF